MKIMLMLIVGLMLAGCGSMENHVHNRDAVDGMGVGRGLRERVVVGGGDLGVQALRWSPRGGAPPAGRPFEQGEPTPPADTPPDAAFVDAPATISDKQLLSPNIPYPADGGDV